MKYEGSDFMKMKNKMIILIILMFVLLPVASGITLEEQTFYDSIKEISDIENKTDYIEEEIISEEDYEKGIKSETHFLYSKDKDGYYKLKITVAGMPSSCYEYVNFRNFKIGASYKGKKQPKVVPGGVVLNHVDFTIKQ